LGKPKAFQVEEDKVLAGGYLLNDISENTSYLKRHRRRNLIPHKTIPVKGNLSKTWRESTRGE
jgi:hypothetical protein